MLKTKEKFSYTQKKFNNTSERNSLNNTSERNSHIVMTNLRHSMNFSEWNEGDSNPLLQTKGNLLDQELVETINADSSQSAETGLEDVKLDVDNSRTQNDV